VTDTDPMLFDPIQDGVPPDPYPLYDRLRRENRALLTMMWVMRWPGGLGARGAG
jgi:hypothetical protein